MSTQTVVDVIVSGSTTTIVDKRIDGITTVAGAAPITEVSGQRPDLGVKTCLLGGEGDILSLTVIGASANVDIIHRDLCATFYYIMVLNIFIIR